MLIGSRVVGVCSWSLRPAGVADLVGQVKRLGLAHVQLALGPLLALDEPRRRGEMALLRDSGIEVTGGMMAYPGEDYATIEAIHQTGGLLPDERWVARKRLTLEAAELAVALGVKAIGTHVGFVPAAGQDRYDVMVKRVREVAGAFADRGVELLMETGQERAAALLAFLRDVGAANVGVNFDPANMILYGAGDPIEAIGVLRDHIRHVHVKDATASAKPGVEWGAEVPFGTGQVGAKRFLAALDEIGYAGPLVIEREAGEQRLADCAAATEALRAAV